MFVVELLVAAVMLEKFLMRATLDDFTVFQYENLVGAADGRQSMRDDKSCKPLSKSRLAVASSKINIVGSARIARAIATR